MLQSIKYTFRGANNDVTKSKHPLEFYYDAEHIRLIATDSQSTGSVTNEKGNSEIISLSTITIDSSANTITQGSQVINYKSSGEITTQLTSGDLQLVSGQQKIIGHCTGRDSIYFISTDDNGGDALWELENILSKEYSLKLLYYRNMNLSSDNLIEMIYNYENENIEKVYWVDGINQIRYINTLQEDLINIPLNTINFVGDFNLSQPTIEDISTGGNHTAGMVQYGYNLYRINSSQTKLSPLSELVPLSKGDGLGGGDVNESVSSTPVVRIDNLDSLYTHIKVYAVRYTSLDVTPSVELIEEREIGSNSFIQLYDDGSNIGSLSLEELIFLGSDPIVPKHITTKDNVLFPVNIQEQNFDIPDEFDMRAFSFPSFVGGARVFDNVRSENGNVVGDGLTVLSPTFNIPLKHDAVNLNYDEYKFQSDRVTLGGTGKYLTYEIVRKDVLNAENKKFFKDSEIYRIGIQFYNKLGQLSFPKWIADFKAPKGNLQSLYNTLRVDLTSEFYSLLNSYNFENDNDVPVGYKIIRSKRDSNDKTILAQGVLTSMMFQVKGDEARNFSQFNTVNNRKNFQDGALKIPTYITREFSKFPVTSSGDNNGVLQEVKHLEWLNDDNSSLDEGGEIHTVTNSSNKISQTFQHTKLMQLHSPEILFDRVTSFPSDTNLRVVGMAQNTNNGVYGEERFIETKLVKHGGRTLGGINPKRISRSLYIEDTDFRAVFDTPSASGSNNDDRFIGPSGGSPDLTMAFIQYYREFNQFTPNTTINEYPIYGSPEIAVRGGDSKFYNNDTRFNYTNSLTSFSSDGEDDCDTCEPIISINSFGSQSASIVLGNSNDSTDNRKGLEDIYNESSINNTTGILVSEIVRDNNFVYLGGIYGGNSYEEKKRTDYIEIGTYTDINTSLVQIDSPGDTFVQNFKYLRIGKTDTEVYDHRQVQKSEIIEFPVETSIDLKNRHDISLNAWDSRFQPQEGEYHSYNTVYSQEPTVIQNTNLNFNFNKVDNFDTRIMASKTKIPNEDIDSWTDILVNEFQDLDGKYGPVNAVLNHRDEIYTFQDEAVSKLIINPRVQVQGSNGLDIELGRGTLLYDYQYITTKSGSRNKWGIVESKNGFYYYDLLNKGLYRFPDSMIIPLSDIKGMHTHFNNNHVFNDLSIDNPVKSTGVVAGYDNYNNDIYITLHQGGKSFTRVYNELQEQFIDKKLYYPSWYINKGDSLYTIANGSESLWEQQVGEYNNFFGQYIPSKITLQVNPAVDFDSIFHNIIYRSEIYLDDIDQPEATLTHLQAYSEYQDSGRIPLIFGRNNNLRRKFREWKADIPREINSRNRMRNPWIFITLELDNQSNYKMILHDIIIQYNIYQ